MKFRSFLLLLTFFVTFAVCTHADFEDELDEDALNEAGTGQVPPKNSQEFAAMYKKMLVKKRKQQQDAVKRMVELNDKKKETDMLNMIMKKLFETLVRSLEQLQTLSKGSKELRFDKETINDVSMIIENTAFAADLALFFPDKFHKLYDKNIEWQRILEASIGFALKTGLLDDETFKAINLVFNAHFYLKIFFSVGTRSRPNLILTKLIDRKNIFR